MEPKLKFYVGDVTAGGLNGVPAKSIQCTFPRLNAASSNTMLCFKFAIRCDDGYRAENVVITYNDNLPASGGRIRYNLNGYMGSGWVQNHTADINVGTVTNKNTLLIMEYNPTYVNMPSYNFDNMENAILTVYASYSEVKL